MASIESQTLARTRDDARLHDEQDPLAFVRARFRLPAGVHYVDGNSLGALPRTVGERLAHTVEHEWGARLVRSWNESWIDLPQAVAEKLSPLLGAPADAIAVTDSVSVNLFKVLAAAHALVPGRATILAEAGEFPTDLYVAEGLGRLLGPALTVRTVAPEALDEAIDDDVAIVLASHVHYATCRKRDMAATSRIAHAHGAVTVFDLSHSAGVVAIDLLGDGVDFAIGCGYKYLNGGPGAPAYLYVAPRWHGRARSPIQGWLGHAAAFDFAPGYQPAPGARAFHCGTWPILSMTALDAALDVFEGVDMGAVERKSRALCSLLLMRLQPLCERHGLRVVGPAALDARGSHVAVRHPEGYAVVRALIDRGIIGDFRPPDLMRFGLVPLYLRYVDVWDVAEALAEVLDQRLWDDPRYRQRQQVT